MDLFITSRPDQSDMNILTLFLLEMQRKKTFFAVNYPGVAHKNGQIKNSNKLIFFHGKGLFVQSSNYPQKGFSHWVCTDQKYGLKTLFLLFNIYRK